MIKWGEQIQNAEKYIKEAHKERFHKKESKQGVLVRFPKLFYKKLKIEARLKKIPMSKLLKEKLSQCEWITSKKVLIEKELEE